jgi:hypothetical protein
MPDAKRLIAVPELRNLEPQKRESLNLNADNIANRPSTETITGHDQAERVVWERCSIQYVGEQNRPIGK